MHAIQVNNPYDAAHPIIIPSSLIGVICSFEARKPTPEKFEDSDILKLDLIMETPLWDPFSSEFQEMELSMPNYREQ